RPKRRFVAVDGEGITGADGVHRYVLMTACDRDGPVCRPLVNPDGLSDEECLSFLCRLPTDALVVGYGLGYDRTKWLETWPAERIAALTPLQGMGCAWHDAWRLTLLGARFTVRPVGLRRFDFRHRLVRHRPDEDGKRPPTTAKAVTVWDT